MEFGRRSLNIFLINPSKLGGGLKVGRCRRRDLPLDAKIREKESFCKGLAFMTYLNVI
jgi:hypothetical protein